MELFILIILIFNKICRSIHHILMHNRQKEISDNIIKVHHKFKVVEEAKIIMFTTERQTHVEMITLKNTKIMTILKQFLNQKVMKTTLFQNTRDMRTLKRKSSMNNNHLKIRSNISKKHLKMK